jgi:glycosyltransferase involved in cell wall biosynthesis
VNVNSSRSAAPAEDPRGLDFHGASRQDLGSSRMTPLISCIVPVLNAERYLAETIDSILAQTYRPIEVLVVDGGSTDGTVEVIRSFGAPVMHLHNPENPAAASGRNLGLAAARGPFVAFLDGDDLWLPGKLAAQMARFEARPDLEVSLTHLENFWSPDVAPDDRWFRGDRRPTIVPGYSPVTVLARRDVFDRHGPWDVSQGYAANSEWFVRIRAMGVTIELLPDAFVRRRLHAANVSRVQASTIYDDHFRLVQSSLDRRRAMAGPPKGNG